MNTSIPPSNRKVFAISFIVAIAALVAFIMVAMNSNILKDRNVDSSVKEEVLDPNKVFDAPITKSHIYYIDLEKYASDTSDPKAIGCGDGVIAKEIQLGEADGLNKSDALSFALNKLFDTSEFNMFASSSAAKGKKPYTALSNSKLTIKSIKDIPGQYEVRLGGTAASGGVCDDPRIMTQIQETVREIFGTSSVKIYIENKPLEEYFSER